MLRKAHKETLKNFENQIAVLFEEKDALCEKIRDSAEESFLAAGGCPRCRGRSWVVVWDTLDSLSGGYAEYGPCPEEGCTEETRKASGLAPGRSHYDDIRGTPVVVYGSLKQQGQMDRLQRMIEDLQVAQDSYLRFRAPVKGSVVEVVAGRKVKPGSQGVILWRGTCRFTGKKRVGLRLKGAVPGVKLSFLLEEYCLALSHSEVVKNDLDDLEKVGKEAVVRDQARGAYY